MATAIPGIAHPTLLLALTALLAPLAAFAVIMTLVRRRAHVAAGLSIAAVSLSFGCTVWLLAAHRHLTAPLQQSWQWMVSGNLSVTAGLLLDPLSLLMAVVVTTICLLVQIYSLGYMAGDPGMGRYYGFMSLFAWAMLSLTLSATLLQLYIFWELVGLASYLLIGFWFEKYSASQAGKKAFVMTRLGDVAFLLGILLVLGHLGNLSILYMNTPEVAARFSPYWLTLAILLIFGGVIGKSAQFPLLTWLPDAMEGPTPVSALLHSATMVAAGGYLFARLFPFFSLSPDAMTVCLAVGTISMLLSSTMAMVARDIKQVWAYSTISQLGFMIMGLAAGSYFAGVFHLTTHAGFKALLFLCSGVLIHHFGTNDMFAISRAGGRGLKVTMVCMTLAAGALSGLPPLAGFFSKEAIMGALAARSNPIWLGAGLLGVFLTAYYAFRLIFVILLPHPAAEADRAAPPVAAEGAHGSAPRWHAGVMNWPLIILALPTVVLGFAQGRLETFLSGVFAGPIAVEGHLPWLPGAALGLALTGLLLAWIEFGRKGAPRMGFVERVPWLCRLFEERWYIDRFYRWFLDHAIYQGVSAICTANDRKVIDGGLDGLAEGVQGGGRLVEGWHRLMTQYRLGAMFAMIFFLTLYFFF
jgi:NADH-quinone oxidoreductase subunit L